VTIEEELEAIAKQHRGILKADDVVKFARDESTALHAKFQWDDTAAAAEYRRWQAREVIKVWVQVVPELSQEPMAVFVSLPSDQQRAGGGYRRLTTVMADEEMRKELLQAALQQLQRVQSQYAQLKELASVFTAIEAAVKRYRHRAA